MAKLSEPMVAALKAAQKPGTTIRRKSAYGLCGYRDGQLVSLDGSGKVTRRTLEALQLRRYLVRAADGFQITDEGLAALQQTKG